MKKIVSLLFVPLLLLLAGCSDSDDPEKDLTIVSVQAEFSEEGGSGTIVVSAPGSVTVKSAESWCEATVSGSTITLSVQPNPANHSRSSEISITCGNDRKTVEVYQHGASISLGVVFFEIDWQEGSVVSTSLQSVGPTEVVSHPDWLEVTVGEDVISITVTESNQKLTERSGTIVLAASGITKTVRVVQQGQPIGYSIFLGDWTLNYAAAHLGETTQQITVTLVENVFESSYKLTGLRYDIHVNFDPQTNRMTVINNNFGYEVGTYSENDYLVRFLLVSRTNTINHTNTTYNMVTEMEFDDQDNMVLNWVDGGVWSSGALSWNFRYYTDPADTGTASSIISYYGPLSMVKN